MISADDLFQLTCYNNLEPKNITNPCLPRVALRRLVYRSPGISS